MGKTKIATIDDSVVEEVKSQKPKVKNIDKKLNAEPGDSSPVAQNDKGAVQDDTFSVIPSGLSEGSQDEKALKAEPGDSSPAAQNDKGEKQEDKKEASEDKPKKKQKPGKRTKVRSKKYQESLEKVERAKAYPLNEAVEHAKEVSYTKFDGTLEIHLNTNQKNLRGLVTLPFSAGKKLNVLAFGEGATDSGADIVGTDEIIEAIGKGKIDFDVVVTTPLWMPKLAKAAKVLGPRGLMPNPKSGTITDNLKKAVLELQSGKTEYKTEKAANVMHLGIGKVSQSSDEVSQNIKILITTIGKSRITKATLSPTMGVGVKLDLSSI